MLMYPKWKVKISEICDGTDMVTVEGDETIAIMTAENMAKDRRIENARLIAAAPDMLEALENLENDRPECSPTMPQSAWDLVQSAIAKAKGEKQ